MSNPHIPGMDTADAPFRSVIVTPDQHPDAYGIQAMVTASGDWHNCRIDRSAYLSTLEAGVTVLQRLDAIKKATWYGREVPEQFYNIVARAGVPTLESGTATDVDLLIWHGIVGMATEAGELLEALLAWEMSGRSNPFDFPNLGEELGDSNWYAALIRYVLGVSDERIKQINIDKLRKRFGAKFDAWAAQQENRDLHSERKILEEIGNKAGESITMELKVELSPEIQAVIDEAHAECERVSYRAKVAEDEAAALRKQLSECQEGYDLLRRKHAEQSQAMAEMDRKYLQRGNEMRKAGEVLVEKAVALHAVPPWDVGRVAKSDDALSSSVVFMSSAVERTVRNIMHLCAATDIARSPGNGDYDPYLRGMANGLILAESIMLAPRKPQFLDVPKDGYVSEYYKNGGGAVPGKVVVNKVGEVMQAVYTGGVVPAPERKEGNEKTD